MTSTTPSAPLADARRARFRPSLVLTAAFAATSLAMELVLVTESVLGTAVDGAVLARCSAVLASALALLLLTVGAARGSRSAWNRVRIISVVVPLAVAVIVSIPGFLPDWVRLEQAVCGLLVLPVAVLANSRRTGALFPKHP